VIRVKNRQYFRLVYALSAKNKCFKEIFSSTLC